MQSCEVMNMNEVRLIDANAYAAEMKVRQDACKEMIDAAVKNDNWELYDKLSRSFGVFVEAKLTLDNMPTVDAVPVTRCGQCKLGSKCPLGVVQCKINGYKHRANWFCADGRRRSE